MRALHLAVLTMALGWAGPAASWAQNGPDSEGTAARDGGDALETRALLTANGLLGRGLHELAAREYRAFLAEHGSHPKARDARYGLAVCLVRQNDHAGAAELLSALTSEDDFEFAAEVLAMLGQCQLTLKQYDDASRALARLLKQHPEHALCDDAAAMLIEARYAAGSYPETAKLVGLFDRRWQDSPLRARVALFGGLAEMAEGHWPAAAEFLERCLQAEPDADLRQQATLLRARCLERTGKASEAGAAYRGLVDEPGRFLADALLGLARVEQGAKRDEQAAALLDRLIQEFPEHADIAQARLLRGRVSLDQGRVDEAATQFKLAGERAPQLGDQAAYWLAKCDMRSGKPEEAATRLEQAIGAFGDSPLLAEMRYDLSAALAQSGRHADAERVTQELIGKDVEPALRADALFLAASTAHRRGDWQASAAHCAVFLENFAEHPQRAAVAFLAAENAFLQDDFAGALQQFDALLETADKARRADIQFRRGMALYRLERMEQAAEVLHELTNGREPAPQHHASHLALGEIAFGRSEWKTAEAELRAYLEKPDVPGRAAALHKLGLALQRQERHADAVEQFAAVLAGDASEDVARHARFERGQSLVILQRDAEAEADFKAVVQSGDERFKAHALNHLAQIALRRNDLAAAQGLLGEASSAPGFAAASDAELQIGQVQLAQGQFAQAEQTLRKFIKANAEHPQRKAAQAQLAIAISRQNRAEDALKVIEPLLKKPDGLDAGLQASLLYEQALCLKALDKPEPAAEALRRLLALETSGPRRPYALAELAELEAAAGDCRQATERLTSLVADGSDAPGALQAQARYRLGVCRFQLEDYAGAAAMLETYLSGAADGPLAASAAYFCGEALFKLGRYADAVRRLQAVVAQPRAGQPDAWEAALLRLGECYAQLQQWAESEQAFARHRAELADSRFAYQADFGVGWARENAGRHAEAIEAYLRVTEKHTGSTAARAQFQIGECLFAQKRLEEAVGELLKVDILYQQPEWSAAALYEAGRCFEQLNRVAEAREQYKQVSERFGETKWARLANERLPQVSAGAVPGRGSE